MLIFKNEVKQNSTNHFNFKMKNSPFSIFLSIKLADIKFGFTVFFCKKLVLKFYGISNSEG